MPSSRKRSRERHRRRSRSRDKRRSRSRHRSRERKHRRHSRSRSYSRSPKREKKVEKVEKKVTDTPVTTKQPEIKIASVNGKLDINALMQGCEEIVNNRRERIARERQLVKEKKVREVVEGIEKSAETPIPLPIVKPTRRWNLEDDDEDEDESSQNNQMGDDESEQDTLEQFMKDFCETKKSEMVYDNTIEEKKGSTRFIKNKKKNQNSDEKNELGEVMEQNPDELEYSSEEEEETLESMSVIAKKDKLPIVDHDKVYYQKVQTNFYIEVPELKNMLPSEITKYRISLGGIKVKGKDCPKPIKTWAHCGLTNKLMTVLKMHKFLSPTPVQCQAIPAIMSGRDVISVAKTGSGKTLAYLLPLLRHTMAQNRVKPGDGPIAVIMVPTRELAVQIYKEISKLVSSKELKYACIYGGTVISEQIAKLKNGAEILVCTPGRMIDMMAANGGRVTNLRRCTFVVLDEADRMFDLGFEPQVMTILNHIRPNRQTVMFSATFPRKMEALARKVLTNPIEIEVGGKSIVCSDVDQNALILDETEKLMKLSELLALYLEGGKVIVFVEKQENADKLISLLMQNGYTNCAAVHGGIDQDDRDSFIANFKTGKLPLLVATSVAARGLDVLDLNLVVNYDCPNHYEDYVHRCGRTGRAGNKGIAYTFITPDQEKYIGDIIKAFKLSGSTPPEQLVTVYNEYKARMKSEDKKVFKSSGFKGKGFQFDEAESQLAMDKKKFAKDTLGLNDSDDETNLDDKITDMFAVKKIVKDVDKNSFNPNIIKKQETNNNNNNKDISADPKEVSKRLEAAKNVAMKLGAQKFGLHAKDQTLATTEALFRRGSSGFLSGSANNGVDSTKIGSNPNAPVSGKDLAAQKAQMIHSKLGYTRNDNENGDPNNPDGNDQNGSSGGSEMIKKYEEELVINDFPNNVRYRLTSKDTMSNLSEFYEVGVSVRGIHMTEGQKSKMEASGERPLYLCLEALSEMKIQAARQEIKRIVKEEFLKLQRNGPQTSKGRYSVL